MGSTAQHLGLFAGGLALGLVLHKAWSGSWGMRPSPPAPPSPPASRARTTRSMSAVLKGCDYYVGVDIGGTTVTVCLVNERGDLRHVVSVELGPDDRSVPGMVALVRRLIEEVVEKGKRKASDVQAVGIGFPGSVDVENGVLRTVANFPEWRNIPLAKLVSEQVNLPVFLENDAKAAALAEMWVGAGKDPSISHLVMITLGTGIGSALICDGRLVRGESGMAGEIGHAILEINGRPCPRTGVRGLYEKYASASAVGIIAQEEIAKNPDLETSLRSVEHVTCEQVFKHAKAGDKFACELVDKTCEIIAVLCINVCRFVDPQLIVLTGGMALAGDQLFDGVRRMFKKHYWSIMDPVCAIVPSKLDNLAGCVGAAATAKYFLRGTLKGEQSC